MVTRWLAAFVALSAGLSAAEEAWLLDEESRVAAYVATELDDFRVGSWRPDKIDPRQPFPEAPDEERKKIPEPVRLEEPPAASRFFRDGDVLWDVSANLRAARVFAGDVGWAIFNETTRRLVLSGTRRDHLRFERFQGYLLGELPIHVAMTLRLLRVHSEELDGVEWTAEVVQERDLTELGSIAVRSRPGAKASAQLGTERCTLEVETEMILYRGDEVIDMRLAFTARLGEDLGGLDIEFATGLPIFNEIPFYLEAGSKDDPQHTLLIEVLAEAQFPDGAPQTQWRVFEDPAHEPPRRKPEFLSGPEPPRDLGNGFVLGHWDAPPTLLEDLDREADDPDFDPFGDAGPDEAGILKAYPVLEDFDGIIGVVTGDVVIDISELISRHGISVVKGGWMGFLPRESVVMAKLDAPNIELMDQLFETLGPNVPVMIRTSVSLIEWDGPAPVDGAPPQQAHRVGKIAALTRPGQMSAPFLRRVVDDEGELLDGIQMEVEPNVGADDRLIDVRLRVSQAGESRADLSTNLMLHTGTPRLLPLGRVDGKSVGAVIEATVVGMDGRVR